MKKLAILVLLPLLMGCGDGKDHGKCLRYRTSMLAATSAVGMVVIPGRPMIIIPTAPGNRKKHKICDEWEFPNGRP